VEFATREEEGEHVLMGQRLLDAAIKYPLNRLAHFPEWLLRKKLYLDFSGERATVSGAGFCARAGPFAEPSVAGIDGAVTPVSAWSKFRLLLRESSPHKILKDGRGGVSA